VPPAIERKVVLVTRATRLDGLIARFNTRDQARFYIEHLGADFHDYETEHRRYHASARRAAELLRGVYRHQIIERSFLPNYIFGPHDVVVALGQDGLVANTLKYLDGQPLIGINPDPERNDGILLPFLIGDLGRVLPEVMAGRRTIREVTMARAALSDGQVLYAVNDLFIGPRTHTSLRYEISTAGAWEMQSSSGLIVSTGLGSTGWLKSIATGSLAIAACLEGTTRETIDTNLPWNAERLVFAVREPFPSRTSQTVTTYGIVTKTAPLKIRSLTPENGVIFSDGIEADYLSFNSGTEAEIGVADRRGYLVS